MSTPASDQAFGCAGAAWTARHNVGVCYLDDVFVKAYSALAEAMGVEYQAQLCDTAEAGSGYEVNDLDVVVDPDVLRDNVARDRRLTAGPANPAEPGTR